MADSSPGEWHSSRSLVRCGQMGAFVTAGVWLHFVDRKPSSSNSVAVATLLVSLFVGNSLCPQESVLLPIEFLIILGHSQDPCVFNTARRQCGEASPLRLSLVSVSTWEQGIAGEDGGSFSSFHMAITVRRTFEDSPSFLAPLCVNCVFSKWLPTRTGRGT